MARASIQKELHFDTSNETGQIGFITIALKDAGVNITHLLGYAVKDRAYFQIVASDIEKAKKVLSAEIDHVQVRDVLIVEFENKLGTLSEVAKLLGSNGIGMEECYGTSSDGFKIVGVFYTSNNERAAKLINDQYQHSTTLG
jgi:hypothetical protein